MKRKAIKSALADSLNAEDAAVKSRFEKAESLLGARGDMDDVERTESPSSKTRSPRTESRTKVVRDTFTLPEEDYNKIAELKERCLGLAKNATKSEVIRAGLCALTSLSDEELLSVMNSLVKVKTGRPSQKV